MDVFRQFPYTNYHDMNLDWVLQTVKADAEAIAQFGSEIAELESTIPATVQARLDAMIADGTFQDMFSGQVNDIARNVRDYGAIIDGATDDTTSLSNAVNGAKLGNNVLNFPAGTLAISGNIPSFHDVIKIGNGRILRDGTTFYIHPNANQYNYLFVAPWGDDTNDGIAADYPLSTIQRALDILTKYEGLPGRWHIKLAAGTYTEGASIGFVRPVNYRLTISGPDVAMNATPTAIIDGTAATKSDGLFFATTGEVDVRNIKIQNFTQAGIRGQRVEQFILRNIHASGCKYGYWMTTHTWYTVYGGIIENCDMGISELYHVLRSFLNATSFETGTTIKDCDFAIHAKEHCTGHLNWLTIENCVTGLAFSRSVTANNTDSKINGCGVGAILRNGSFLTQLNTEWTGNTTNWLVDSTSGFVLSELEMDGSNWRGAGERIANYVENSAASAYTGSGYATLTNVLESVSLIPKGSMTRKGTYYKVVIQGTRTGTGDITLGVRFGGGIAGSLLIPSGTNGVPFRYECMLTATGKDTQKAFAIVNSPLGVKSTYATRTYAFSTSALDIDIPVQIVTASDSITIYDVYVYTTDAIGPAGY